MDHPSPAASDAPKPDPHPPASIPRVFVGGVLMGLANLVPGVSGGTMILALGLYDRFIEAIAELARLRPTMKTLLFLVFLGLGLATAVVTLATPAVWLVTEHRWLAYSLFIGMTLGGVPMLWKIVRPLDAGVVVSAVVGFGAMAALAFGMQATVLPPTVPVLLVAGALAASSMILPGISGSYILLILGLYDVVIGSLRPASLQASPEESVTIILPVAVGAALGIGVLSNLLKAMLERFQRRSHAVLLGLLVGSVLGLWPFQGPVHPDLADETRRDALIALVGGATPEQVAGEGEIGAGQARALLERYGDRTPGELELLALELETYTPSLVQGLTALLVLGSGVTLTLALSFSRGRARPAPPGPAPPA